MSANPLVGRPGLFVEGHDDAHAVARLLECHGTPVAVARRGRIGGSTAVSADIIIGGGDRQTLARWLDAVGRAVKPAAIALDANGSAEDRWRSVRGKLAAAGVETPTRLPLNGFVGRGPLRAPVGGWIMPNNESPGALEEFIESLIPDDDVLWPHADSSTKQARTLVPGRSDVWEVKARLRAWLSWQPDPGYPIGKAMRARYLDHDSELARAFVAWFRRVFTSEADRPAVSPIPSHGHEGHPRDRSTQ